MSIKGTLQIFGQLKIFLIWQFLVKSYFLLKFYSPEVPKFLYLNAWEHVPDFLAFKGTFSLQISTVFCDPQGKEEFLAFQAEQWKFFTLKN